MQKFKIHFRVYKTEEKMNQFYHLLVKESLNNEDVAALSKDNVRDCHEIDQAFKTSNDCYNSYVYRVVQLNFTPEIEVFICCLRDLFLLVRHLSNSI